MSSAHPRRNLKAKIPLSAKLWLRRVLSGLSEAPSRLTAHVSAQAKRLGLEATPEPVQVPPFDPAALLLLEGEIDELLVQPQRSSSEVRVSIIIPVFNKVEFTFQCLRSLVRTVDFDEVEVIVVDNASTDDTDRLLSAFKRGVRVIVNSDNHGFVDACNQAAEIARGEYLVFLNNDTVVLPGWLKHLTQTADNDPSVGAVGSMFLYPDGRVQEAGAIVWQDGNAHHYGWGGSPDDHRLNFARETDYCSAASLLVRKDLFAKLGGFDRRFAPAYYEDIDMCFGVRSLGHRVVYQPASRVIHYEGVTAGRDTRFGMKHFQETNRAKFVDKWREVLEREHLVRDLHQLETAATRRGGPRIVIFDDRVPTPDRDAGSARMFQILKSLAAWSRPLFVSLSQPLPEYEELLWQEGIETGRAVDYARILKRKTFAAAILSRPEVAEAMFRKVRRANSKTKIIFDMVDAYFIRLRREYEVNRDAEILEQARRYEDLERELARGSDQVWCNSSEDKIAMSAVVPAEKIVVIPTIHSLQARANEFDQRAGLLFVGHLAHRPNSDAVHFLIREILPLIRASLPGIKLEIIGTATKEIAVYDSEEIKVRGYVPDIAPFFHRSRVFVAPLRFGAGTKGKIGDALAYGMPLVTTSIGAEGTGLSHGIDAMIADDPQAFADAVIDVYRSRELWQHLADGGYQHVGRNFTPEIVARTIHDAMAELNVLPHQTPRPDQSSDEDKR